MKTKSDIFNRLDMKRKDGTRITIYFNTFSWTWNVLVHSSDMEMFVPSYIEKGKDMWKFYLRAIRHGYKQLEEFYGSTKS